MGQVSDGLRAAVKYVARGGLAACAKEQLGKH